MYRKTIAAALATLSLVAVAAPVAQASTPRPTTLNHATYPYRSGHMTRVLFGHHTYRILLSTWS